MGFLSALIKFVTALVRSVLFDSTRHLAILLGRFGDVIRRCLARRTLSHNAKGRSLGECTPIKRPEFKRPDPLIYSQSYLMGLGVAVTWDNPDITLQKVTGPLHPNAPPDPSLTVPSSKLEPDTEYDVVARIWNGSDAAPVVGLGVKFSVHGFAIGALHQPIGVATANLGVKGGPGCPAFARTRWRTPASRGHYCIQVLLDWFDDLNPANNLGQENTLVGMATSPAQFEFTLGNRQKERRTFRFEVDAYAIPETPSCELIDRARERDARNAERRRRENLRAPIVAGRPETFPSPDVPPQHLRRNHPLPEGWTVELQPAEPTLGAGDEMPVNVIVTPRPGFVGRQPINVNAFDAGGFVGGVTLYVEKA
jgi:hypothetical protein